MDPSAGFCFFSFTFLFRVVIPGSAEADVGQMCVVPASHGPLPTRVFLRQNRGAPTQTSGINEAALSLWKKAAKPKKQPNRSVRLQVIRKVVRRATDVPDDGGGANGKLTNGSGTKAQKPKIFTQSL